MPETDLFFMKVSNVERPAKSLTLFDCSFETLRKVLSTQVLIKVPSISLRLAVVTADVRPPGDDVAKPATAINVRHVDDPINQLPAEVLRPCLLRNRHYTESLLNWVAL